MYTSILFAVVLALLFEDSSADRLVAAGVGTCVRKRAYGIITMRRWECDIMGGRWNGNPSSWTGCHLDWCQITHSGRVASGIVWAVCEYDDQTAKTGRTYGIVSMERFECDRLNGKYNGNPKDHQWISCHLFWCKFSGADKKHIEGIVPSSVGQCSGPKVAYGIIHMKQRECSVLRGKWNGNPRANDWTACHLDWCVTINCEPRDEWKDIQICSNKASTASSKCSIQYTVGTSRTKGSSSTTSHSLSVTVEHSVGVELEGLFSASTKVGITTGFSWSKTNSNSATFSKSTQRSIEVKVPPKTAVRVQQVVGYCGNYQVDTVHYRIVDF